MNKGCFMNKKLFNLLLLGILSSHFQLGFAKLTPTDVVGRDLDQYPLGWIGHVGIVTAQYVGDPADYVVETLNEVLVLQINTSMNFKRRSPYWGAKYGINKNQSSGTRIINEGAFQTSLKCAEYTYTAQWKSGTGQWGVPFTCPKFRCDTFVNYLYWWGGYSLPTYSDSGSIPRDTLPRSVFKSFPTYRNENYKRVDLYNDTLYQVPFRDELNINNASIEELNDMSFTQFIKAVDLAHETITRESIYKILDYSDNPILSKEKRLFLLDKLGFIARIDMLPKLIDMYYKYEQDEDISHMILIDTQDIYQNKNWLISYPKERKLLHDFYTSILDQPLSPKSAPIVIRGFTSLGLKDQIFNNKHKIDDLFNSNIMDISINLALKIALAFKSEELEHYYIPEIITLLKEENKLSLDILFAGAVVGKLSNNGLNALKKESKFQIMDYLSSIDYKLETNINKNPNDMIWPHSKGILLEAKALVSSPTYDAASLYVHTFLYSLKKDELKKYIPGFSNSEYMRKAFNNYPLLIDFKKQNNELYMSTVGLVKK
jgi:hypothetical protein